MASPDHFREENFLWKGWKEGSQRAEVLDLPAHRSADGSQTISCWKLTWLERVKALLFGRVWLHVLSTQHPPVYVSSDRPFEVVQETSVDLPDGEPT